MMTMPTIQKILAATALCLAVGGCLACTSKASGNNIASSASAEKPAAYPGCIRADAANRVSVPIIEVKSLVASLEDELNVKLIRLQALSEQHNRNRCCWEMVFCDAQGRTLILQVAPSGVVYGDKSHREIWSSDIQIGFIADYSKRLEIPWEAMGSFERQQNSRIIYLEWDGNRWMCLLETQRGRFSLQ